MTRRSLRAIRLRNLRVFGSYGVIFAQLIRADSDAIVIKGSRFLYGNGTEFLMRGLLYEDEGNFAENRTNFIDSLADGPTCARDIPYLTRLGINTLQLNHVNPTVDHTPCMRALEAAGIYVLLGLGTPSDVIFLTYSWDYLLQNRYTQVIDSFQNFQNVLGFFLVGSADTLPFVKAATRDLKTHITQKGYRKVPVGYLGFDRGLPSSADFLICGDKSVESDFFVLVPYPTCLNTSSATPQTFWDKYTSEYANYSAPTAFAEIQCDLPNPEDLYPQFNVLYGSSVTSVFSGAIIENYHGSTWGKNYSRGLVQIRSGNVVLQPSYSSLSSQLAAIQPSTASMEHYTINTGTSPCSSTLSVLSFSGSPTAIVEVATNLPPTPNSRLCSCMMQSLECAAKYNASTIGNTFDPDDLTNICGADQSSPQCLGIQGNASIGQYGAFSVCNETERISWVYNQLYKSQGGNESGCMGAVAKESPRAASQAKDCQAFLRQAGPAGTGLVTYTPVAAAGPGNTEAKTRGSLDSAAKIGIGIGVAVFVILCLSLGLLFFRFRRKKRSSTGANDIAKAELEDNPVSPAAMVGDVGDVGEIDGAEKKELQGTMRSELDSSKLVELPGDELIEFPTEDTGAVELEAPHNGKP